jgi:pyruvate formate lyase activating enzyme
MSVNYLILGGDKVVEKNGIIFNLQKYSIHDGPGIRTTVFFKGCPLNCVWCHNPESQHIRRELMFWEDRCTLCGNCKKACNSDAIEYKESSIIYHKDKCVLCGSCTEFCPRNALELSGKDITKTSLMKEIEKDLVFYEESGGGVTFSGGEPLMQIDFLEGILTACNKKGIHTTLDTTLFSTWGNLLRIAPFVDLFLIDLKHMDSKKHKELTGVPNESILENIRGLSALKKNIYIRIPIIPGINDDEKNLKETAEFILELNIIQVNILPYHKIGTGKYNRLHREYKLSGLEEPSKEHMQGISELLEQQGLKVKIGG